MSRRANATDPSTPIANAARTSINRGLTRATPITPSVGRGRRTQGGVWSSGNVKLLLQLPYSNEVTPLAVPPW